MKIFGREFKFNGFDIFHKGNMGHRSGFDADLLDGKESADFAEVNHNHNIKDINIEIGGNNLLVNSKLNSNFNGWTVRGTPAPIIAEKDGIMCTNIKGEVGAKQFVLQNFEKVESNTIYTLSAMVKNEKAHIQGTTNPMVAFLLDGVNINEKWIGCENIVNDGVISPEIHGWKKYIYTFKIPDVEIKHYDLLIYSRDVDCDIYFYDIKIEKGNLATAWSPASEDMYMKMFNKNTFVGYRNLPESGNNVGDGNTSLGYMALLNNTSGINNVSIGAESMINNTDGSSNIALGYKTLQVNAIGECNVAIGESSLRRTSGSFNTSIGYGALTNATEHYYNTAIGYKSLENITTGESNVGIGRYALRYMQDGSANEISRNNIGIGYDSRCSGDNQIQLGNSTNTTYCYGAVQDRSDMRDKADIEETQLGLKFILDLKPKQFRWDYRDDYYDSIMEKVTRENGNIEEVERIVPIHKDGSRKRNRLHQGFIAQEVKETIDKLNQDFAGYQDHKIKNGCDVLSLGYTEFIAPIVKAIQEQQAIIDKQSEEIKSLKNIIDKNSVES